MPFAVAGIRSWLWLGFSFLIQAFAISVWHSVGCAFCFVWALLCLALGYNPFELSICRFALLCFVCMAPVDGLSFVLYRSHCLCIIDRCFLVRASWMPCNCIVPSNARPPNTNCLNWKRWTKACAAAAVVVVAAAAADAFFSYRFVVTCCVYSYWITLLGFDRSCSLARRWGRFHMVRARTSAYENARICVLEYQMYAAINVCILRVNSNTIRIYRWQSND